MAERLLEAWDESRKAIANTPGITLEGPKGRVTIENGVVCARRHIHMSTADAARLGIADHANVADVARAMTEDRAHAEMPVVGADVVVIRG